MCEGTCIIVVQVNHQRVDTALTIIVGVHTITVARKMFLAVAPKAMKNKGSSNKNLHGFWVLNTSENKVFDDWWFWPPEVRWLTFWGMFLDDSLSLSLSVSQPAMPLARTQWIIPAPLLYPLRGLWNNKSSQWAFKWQQLFNIFNPLTSSIPFLHIIVSFPTWTTKKISSHPKLPRLIAADAEAGVHTAGLPTTLCTEAHGLQEENIPVAQVRSQAPVPDFKHFMQSMCRFMSVAQNHVVLVQ